MLQEAFNNNIHLGILGGGQLGQMFLENANRYGLTTHVLDPNPQSSSAHLCHRFVEGSFKDYDTVMAFGKDCDVLTVEIEHVNIDALKDLKKQGKVIHPAPEILETIIDKGSQKLFYKEHELPTSSFELFPDKTSLIKSIGATHSFPFVIKARTGGYDGKGVWVVKSEKDLDLVPDAPLLLEELVEIEKEIGILGCGNGKEVTCFDPVEMVFDHQANLLDILVAPAKIPDNILSKARAVAMTTAKKFNIQGLLAIELFITREGKVLINEVAPRPHNSGHHTIEACFSSQFDAHLRGILSWEFGAVELQQKAVMVNLLGAEGHSGEAYYEGAEQALKTEGCFLHLYGKKETKPFRKMGHFTICGENLDYLVTRAKSLKNNIQIKAK